MPKSSREFIVTFNPDFEKEFTATGLCVVSGRKEALVLTIHGNGKGPDIEFSFTSLDVGEVLVTTTHTSELILHNKSEIEAIYSLNANSSVIKCSQKEGIIPADGFQVILITLQSAQLGPFEEKINFEFLGSSKIHSLAIRLVKVLFLFLINYSINWTRYCLF